jgi:hypothetical protein
VAQRLSGMHSSCVQSFPVQNPSPTVQGLLGQHSLKSISKRKKEVKKEKPTIFIYF